MNWWLAYLVVVPITLCIYAIVIWFQMIGRVDRFRERKRAYYHAALDFTSQYAASRGALDSVQDELVGLRRRLDVAFSTEITPINAWLSFFLWIITLDIWGLVVLYKLNKAWYRLQVVERDFDDRLSVIWQRLGLLKYPLTFHVDTSKNRSFLGNLVLTIVTLGIWGIVWNYKIYTDPDRLYADFHGVEDTVLNTARAA